MLQPVKEQILIVNALQAFKSRIEEMREAIQRNRQRKPFPSPLPPSTSRQKKAKVRRKSEDKAAAAAAAGDRAATPPLLTPKLACWLLPQLILEKLPFRKK